MATINDDPLLTDVRTKANALGEAVAKARKAGWTVELEAQGGKLKISAHRRLEQSISIDA